jgi:uncharacterized protein YciI
MADFFFKLNAPRATFAADITDEEKALMGRHAAYWRGLMHQGIVLAFGPVFDPKGHYGIGIARGLDAQAAGAMAAGDPVIKAERGFTYDIHPMLAVTQGSTQ